MNTVTKEELARLDRPELEKLILRVSNLLTQQGEEVVRISEQMGEMQKQMAAITEERDEALRARDHLDNRCRNLNTTFGKSQERNFEEAAEEFVNEMGDFIEDMKIVKEFLLERSLPADRRCASVMLRLVRDLEKKR